MKQKGFAPVMMILIIAGLLVVGGVWYYEANKTPASSQPSIQQVNQQPPNNPTPIVTSSSTKNDQTVSPTSSPASSASPSLVSTTPTSGPAGTMVVLHGTFSTCGNQVPAGECTEDRFNQPVFLQGGTSMSGNITTFVGSQGNIVYQVPPSLEPGKYEFAIQNCLGKGCTNYHIGWFTVVAPNAATVPVINSISPQSISSNALPGAVITIHGNNFLASNNYVSFIGDGTTFGNDGSPDNYDYMSAVISPDGKTITFRLPTSSDQYAYNSTFYSSDGGFEIAVSNMNGTSNFATLKTQ